MLKKQSDLLSSMEGRTARPQVHETKFPSKHVRLLQALAANFGSIRYLMQQLTRQSLPAFGLDGSGLDAFSKPLLKAAESEGVSTEDEEEVQRGYAVLWTLQAVAVQLVDNGLQVGCHNKLKVHIVHVLDYCSNSEKDFQIT